MLTVAADSFRLPFVSVAPRQTVLSAFPPPSNSRDQEAEEKQEHQKNRPSFAFQAKAVKEALREISLEDSPQTGRGVITIPRQTASEDHRRLQTAI